METKQSVFSRYAAVLAVAGAAAGVAGAFAGLVLRKRGQPTVGEQVRSALDRHPRQDVPTRDSLASLVDEVRRFKSRTTADAANTATSVRKSKRKGRKARKAATDSAATIGSDLKHQLSRTGETVEQTLPVLLDKVVDTVREYLDATPEKAGGAYETRRAQAAKLKRQASGRKEELVQEMDSAARDTLENRIKPGLERATSVAASSAEDIRKRIEKEASQLEKRYGKTSPRLKAGAADMLSRLEAEARDFEKRYEKAKPKLKSGAAEARTRLEEEAKELEKRFEDAKPVLEDSASRVAAISEDLLHAAEDRLQTAEQVLHDSADQGLKLASEAGATAKQGGKNLTSLLFWLTVSGGLIYAFLLNDEQKKTARSLAESALKEGLEIYKDVRGQDGDFRA